MRNYEMEELYKEETEKVAFQGNYTCEYVSWLEDRISRIDEDMDVDTILKKLPISIKYKKDCYAHLVIDISYISGDKEYYVLYRDLYTNNTLISQKSTKTLKESCYKMYIGLKNYKYHTLELL